MRAALVVHDEVLRSWIEAHDGFLFSHTGDGVDVAFASPRSVVDAAVAAQRRWSCRFPHVSGPPVHMRGKAVAPCLLGWG